jgi:hypothetical protein
MVRPQPLPRLLPAGGAPDCRKPVCVGWKFMYTDASGCRAAGAGIRRTGVTRVEMVPGRAGRESDQSWEEGEK